MKKKLMKYLEKILAMFSRIYLTRTKPFIVGVTGSVGKTSARVIISQVFTQILADEKIVYTSPKNFNSELGLIFSIFKIESFTPTIKNLIVVSCKIIFRALFTKKKYDILVLEYGIDHPGDMDFLLTIAKPDIAVFTKLDSVHREYFDSDTGIWDEKIKLLKNAKQKIYLNNLDENCKKYYEDFQIEKTYYSDEISGAKNYKLIKKDKEIVSSFLCGNTQITSNLLGIENAQYVCLALQMIEDLPSYLTSLSEGEEHVYLDLALQGGRFSVFEGIEGSILIDSSYNATLGSMKQMISNTIALRNDIYPGYKLGFVLGDMRELGEQSEEAHLALGKFTDNYDLFYTVGEETKKYIQKSNVHHFLSSRKAGDNLKTYLENTDEKYIILFKGSQNTIFTEEALKSVLLSKADEKKLVRQDNYWGEKKKEFFENI